jgi:hypothetical protein
VPSSLQTRVKRLEGSSGSGCPRCGFDGDWSKVRTECFWSSSDEGRGSPEDIYCGTCGRPIHIVMTWGDALG